MKRTSLLTLACMLLTTSYSQVLQGIGELKLGKTVQELQTSIGIKNIYRVNSDKEGDKKLRKDDAVVASIPFSLNGEYGNTLYKIENLRYSVEWPLRIFPRLAPSLKDISGIEIYYMPVYKIANILVKGVYLTFQQNKLVLIETNPDRTIIDALRMKYPTPDTSFNTSSIKCRYNFTGAEKDEMEFRDTVNWNNQSTFVSYVFNLTHTTKCAEDVTGYTRFFDKNFLTFFSGLKQSQSAKDHDEELKMKKNLLDSL